MLAMAGSIMRIAEMFCVGGAVLGSCVLMHPYEAEQPFTRLLPGIRIPQG
jgi:hypothetical protein